MYSGLYQQYNKGNAAFKENFATLGTVVFVYHVTTVSHETTINVSSVSCHVGFSNGYKWKQTHPHLMTAPA